jgi:hypothetical protein
MSTDLVMRELLKKTRRNLMRQENETEQLTFQEQVDRSPEAIAFQKLIAEQREWVEALREKVSKDT